MAKTNGGNGGTMTADQAAALAKADKPKRLADRMAEIMPSVLAALPKHVDGGRFERLIFSCVRNDDTGMLRECTLPSLMGAAIECALLGLEPNTRLEHCWIIPYRDTRRGVVNANLQMGYKGYIALAYRANVILEAHTVHDGDVFDVSYGSDRKIVHKPNLTDKRGEPIMAYALARPLSSPEWVWQRVATRDDIRAAQNASQSFNARNNSYSPWVKHAPAMMAKTAIIRLAGQLPLQVESWARAVALGKAEMDGRALLADGDLRDIASQAKIPLDLDEGYTPGDPANDDPGGLRETTQAAAAAIAADADRREGGRKVEGISE